MKASELRIGNYVYRQSSKLKIDKSSMYQIENVNLQSALKYDPIPLTEEWLLKFGFIKGKEQYFYKTMGIEVFFNLCYDGILKVLFKGYVIQNIIYINQLQNLYFALTGEELTVNN